MKKNQILQSGGRPALAMLLCSCIAFSAAAPYEPIVSEQKAVKAAAAVPSTRSTQRAAAATSAETAAQTQASEPVEKEYIPAPYLLNLAYQFPNDSSESYAETLMKELIQRDSQWYAEIYDMANLAPKKLAERLGIPAQSVLGKYNPVSKKQEKEDPSTWSVEHFKNVRVSFYDGDGNVTSAVSNAQNILSMASVYTYYHNPQDISAVRKYMNALWEISHSYNVSMGEVYYCEGCIDPSQQLEEEEMDSDLENEDTFNENRTIHTEIESPSSGEGTETIPETAESQSGTTSGESKLSSTEASTIATSAEPGPGNPLGIAAGSSAVDGSAIDASADVNASTVASKAEDISSAAEIVTDVSSEAGSAADISFAANGATGSSSASSTAGTQQSSQTTASEMKIGSDSMTEIASEASREDFSATETLPVDTANQQIGEETAAASEETAKSVPAVTLIEETEKKPLIIRHDVESGDTAAEELSSAAVSAESSESFQENENSTEENSTEEITSSAPALDTSPTPESTGNATPQPSSSEAPSAVENERREDERTSDSAKENNKICPGHIDLKITAKIYTVSEDNNLYSIDQTGNTVEEPSWTGWTSRNKAFVRHIDRQNWADEYGLNVAVAGTRAPLSDAEIESYMNQLPADTTEERKQLVRFALQSVGKVPYYWGGKPSSTDYSGNHFGSVTVPDHGGRILKGLDCSGWINWVYWAVRGSRLMYEGTDGLRTLGRQVDRQDLKPGDIVVITGSTPHVIMFMNFTSDGQIQCVHETGSANNVTVGVMNANWPYYRNLLD